MDSSTDTSQIRSKQSTASSTTKETQQTAGAKNSTAASTCSAVRNHEKQKKTHDGNLKKNEYNKTSDETRKIHDESTGSVDIPAPTVSPQSEQIMKDTWKEKEDNKNNSVQTTPQQKHDSSTPDQISQKSSHDFRPYNVQMRQVTDDNNITKNTSTISKVEQKNEKSNDKDPKKDSGSEPKTQTDKSISTEKQIYELLIHRRLLLNVIRQCRMACTERIKQKGSNNNDEVEEFRKITRIALQAIKRPQGQEKSISTIQQRGAISLRKGASVGKKMAAAVSTLNNSGGWISDSSSSTGPSQVQSAVYSNGASSPTPTKDNLATSGKRDNSISMSNKSGKLPLQTAINIKNNKLEQKIPSNPPTACLSVTNKKSRKESMTQQNTLPTISSSKSITPVTSKMKDSSSSMQPNKVSSTTQPTQKIKRANSFKNAPYYSNLGNSSVESIYSSNTHSVPLHLSQSGGKPFSNPLIPSNKMRPEEQKQENEELKIYHSEVNKLLKKRKALQIEITARHQKRRIIDRKKGKNQPQLQKPRKKHLGKNSSQIIPTAIERKQLNSFPNELYRHEQKPLPCRRKTHWDYVLEEMRWLATDFIEERKWKAANGRSMASAVQSYFREKITSPGRSPLKLCHEKRSVDQEDIPQKNEENDEISEKKEKNEQNKNLLDSLPISCNDSCLKEIKPSMYNEPTVGEVQSARDISKLMNLMVLTHLKSISNTRILGHSDSPNDELLCRAEQHFSRVKERLGISSIKTDKKLFESNTNGKNDASNLPSNDIESKQMVGTEVNDVKKSSNHSHGVNIQTEELSHDEITSRLGKIASKMDKLRKEIEMVDDDKSEDSNKNEVIGSITLKHCQNLSIKFFENLWESDGNTVPVTSGAILSGPFGSGKTVSVGALLWKRRSLGSQILLCASASFIRWRYELQRFEGLHVLTFGLQGWGHDNNSHTNQSQSFHHQKCNVILCEFSAFKRLCEKYCDKGKGILSKTESNSNEPHTMIFATTVLDARCLSAPSTKAHINGKRQDRSKGSNISLCIPHELFDVSWWHRFHSFQCFEKSKFLLLETSGYSMEKTSPHDYDNETIEGHQIIQILARKLAFINHQFFSSKLVTPESNACQWASKSCSDDSEKEPNITVNEFLVKSIISQTYFLEGALCCQNKNQTEMSSRHWNIKLCTLPNIQKRLYDESCFHLRGMLSSLGKRKDNGKKSSENVLLCTDCRSLMRSTGALMRLRRLCMCSNMCEILSFPNESHKLKDLNGMTKTNSNDESISFLKLLCGSPSQPNADFAVYVLDRSAKLRELYKFMTDKCGYKNHFNHPYLNSKEVTHCDHEKILEKKKILILATLPEAQILISKFLNSVGFAHELLMTHSYSSPNKISNQHSTGKFLNGCSYKAIKQHMHDKANDVPESFFMSWIRSQQSTSRYSMKSIDGSNKFISTDPCHILVSSPENFDSSSGGLIPSSTDIVISLDEDWSGKGNLLLDAIVSKICLHKECSSKSSPTLIKLITEGTCEQTFFQTSSTCENQNRTIHDIPIELLYEININDCKLEMKQDDSLPSLKPLISKRIFEKISNLSNLGQNIFRFYDASLSSILQTNELLPDELQNGKQSKFLSSHNLLSHENLCHDESEDANNEAIKMLSSYARIFGMILAQVEQCYSWIDFRIAVNDDIFFKELITSIDKDVHSPQKFSLFSTAVSAAFPNMISSRRDISSKPIQLFIERLKSAYCPSNNVQANVPFKEQKLCILSTSKNTSEGEEISPDGMDMDFDSSCFFHGLGNKSESLAMSFLHYSDDTEQKNTIDSVLSNNKIIHDINQEDTISETKICESNTCKMVAKNRYAHLFSSLDCNGGSSLQDGNQGRESVVYFPPLFPGLLLTYHKNVIDSKNWIDALNESVKKSLKRKISHDETLTSKRIRTGTEEQKITTPNDDTLLSLDFEDIAGTNSMTDDDLASAFISSHAEVEAMCADLPNMETSDILFSSPLLDASTPRRDISEDPLLLDSDIPIDTKATIENVQKTHDDNPDSKRESGSDSVPDTIYGDFGILGFGILPTRNESHRIASTNTVRVHSDSISNFGSIPTNNVKYIDSEVSNVLSTQTYRGASLDSVIVFVKYRPNNSFLQENVPRIAPSIPYAPSNITKSMNSAIPSSDFFRPIVSSNSPNQVISASENNQSDHNMVGSRKLAAKKQKKIPDVRTNIGSMAINVSSTNLEHTSFSSTININFPPSFQTNVNDSSGCSAVKGQMTSDILGNIRFDAVFQSSYLDLRDSIQNEVNKGQHVHNTSEDSASKRDWILGIQKFSQSDQSEAAQSKPTDLPVNEKKLRVDFGPFQIGRFILLDRAKINQKDVSVKSGISLPMGVKMPHAKRDTTVESENSGTWSSVDDNQLQYYFDCYPFNWNAIARSISYRSDLCQKQELRSARQCRERWEILSKQTKVNHRISNSGDASTSGMIPSMLVALKKSLKLRNSTGNDRSLKNGMNSTLVTISDREQCLTKGYTQHTLLFNSSCVSKSGHVKDINFSKSEKAEDLLGPKSVIHRLRASKNSILKRQHIPLTIPGYTSGNVPSTLPISSPHPSHSHSVQNAVSGSMNSNGSMPSRTEMWPLQLLDSLGSQAKPGDSKTVTTTKQVVPSSPQHYRSQQGNILNPTQHHSPNPYPQIHQQAHVNQPIQQQQASMKPASSATRPQSKQDLLKQAARAAALAVPPNRSRTSKSMGDSTLRPNSSQHTMQLPPQITVPNQHSAPISASSLPSHTHSQQQIPTGSLPIVSQTPAPTNVTPPPIVAPYNMNPNQRNHPTQQTSIPPAYNSQKGRSFIKNTAKTRR